MPTFSRVIKRVIWSSAAALTAATVFHSVNPEGDVAGSKVVAQDDEDPFGGGKPQYQGLRSCVPCHNEEIKADDPFVTMTPEFCALNEVRVFTKDKHLQAFDLLKGELGQHMQKILAESRNDPDYQVTEDRQCLSCHADWQWKKGIERPPLVEFGVGCESCHGPSSLWEGPHDDARWRKLSAQEKEEKYGFIDVRNPIRRARQCFSCHIGNGEQGKVVTHEMYGAGHPPLPGIEIESFAAQMPSHWRYLQEKGPFKFRSEYIEANYPELEHSPLKDRPRTKSVMIGGVVAVREAVNLVASEAVNDDSKHWPELAVFDCSACHHDLQSDSWRQKRGYGASIPGRPQIFVWPEALVELGIRHRADYDEAAFEKEWAAYEEKMDALRRVLDQRPFGDPKAIQAVTQGEGGLLAWLDQLAEDIFRSPVTEKDARRSLDALLSLGPQDYPDFHSARQILWAIRKIQIELKTDIPEFEPPAEGETEKEAIQRALTNLERYTDWKEGARAEKVAAVKDDLSKFNFNKKLRLDLPAGQDNVIAEHLKARLEAISSYNPEWFRTQLEELKKTLGQD